MFDKIICVHFSELSAVSHGLLQCHHMTLVQDFSHMITDGRTWGEMVSAQRWSLVLDVNFLFDLFLLVDDLSPLSYFCGVKVNTHVEKFGA